ncbi:MAG: hypothetical protein JF599_06000 [Verrucomicrobia bacterium]|nr:hypothetical protein [Verrucomicrobiota bacterium]
MKALFLSIGLVTCLIQAAKAQSESETTSPSVSTEFTIIGASEAIPDLSYRQGGHFQKLTIPAFARSKIYKYSGPAHMGFYSNTPSSEKQTSDAKTKESLATSVTFEAGVQHYTVIITGQSGSYQAQAIPDDETSFPVGHARLSNLCPVSVAIRCNQGSTITLAPNQSTIVSPRPDNLLITETAYSQNGTWKRANDDLVPVPTDSQISIFFLQSDSNHFKSVDGISRSLQMVILQEKPADRNKPTSDSSIAAR